MVVHTVLDAAQAIARALGVRFGEVTIQVSDSGVVLVRRGETLRPEALAGIDLEPDELPPVPGQARWVAGA